MIPPPRIRRGPQTGGAVPVPAIRSFPDETVCRRSGFAPRWPSPARSSPSPPGCPPGYPAARDRNGRNRHNPLPGRTGGDGTGESGAGPSQVGESENPPSPHHAAGEEVESLMVPVLFAPGKEELHPEADPEKGFAPKSFLLDHLIEPPFRQLPHRIPEGPHAGEDDPGGLLDGFRIGGDGVGKPHPLQGAADAVQVA